MASQPNVLAFARTTGGYYHGQLLVGLTREIAAAGGRLIVAQTIDLENDGTDDYAAPAYSVPVGWDEVDGVVVVAEALDQASLGHVLALGKPVVLASHQVGDAALPSAVPDNHGGVTAAVEHLLHHGHTRIGFVGSLDQHDFEERRAAWARTLERHGHPALPELFYESLNYSEAGGEIAARAFLERPERPTAMVFATDYNALGFLRLVKDAGVRIPEDLAVIGFDNLQSAAFGTPSLSSVFQRFDQVGALAGRLLISALRGEHVAPTRHIASGYSLAVRASCGCRGDLIGRDHVSSLRVEVVPAARSSLETDILTTLRRTEPGLERTTVRDLLDRVDALIGLDDGTPSTSERHDPTTVGARLRVLVVDLVQMCPDPQALHTIAAAVAEYAALAGESLDGDHVAHGAALVQLALMRLQLGGYLESTARTEALAREQHWITEALLTAQTSMPASLGWLAGSSVRAAVLGLWTDGGTSREVRIAGVHGHTLQVDRKMHDVVRVEAFPPPSLVAAANLEEGEVCLVVPVRNVRRDWGLLAVVTRLGSVATRETFLHWSSLLCAALEAEELQAAARHSEERYTLAAAATNEGLWEATSGSSDLYVSDRCRSILGIPPGRPVSFDSWAQTTHPDDRDRVVTAMRAAVTTGAPGELEYRVVRPDGTTHWVFSCSVSTPARDGGATRVVGSLADVSPRKALEEQLRVGALYDAVTGLPNRRLFLDRLAHAVKLPERDPGARYAVVFLDLDGFKLVNDSLGHLAGDELLVTVGHRLLDELRTVDTAARFGGDEFAVLLTDPSPDEVLVIAARLQRRIAEPVMIDGHEVSVTASVGIALSGSGSGYVDPEDVLRDADTAMYDAKGTRRGTAAVFDPTMHARASSRLRTRSELRAALVNGEFVVHYQPIVSTDGGIVRRFEALVRWEHPERGLLQPGTFLPALEDNAAIVDLGAWILDEVCRQIAVWRSADVAAHEVSVSVNLSHQEFWSPDLLSTVRTALERHGVPPRCLALELTETIVMARLGPAQEIMSALRGLGVRLHIDDFGTGHSSLSALQTLPVDTVKIDGSFVREMTETPRAAALIGIIVRMAEVLGLAVVAECVETAEQARLLRSMGCDDVQGWLVSKAVPGKMAGDLLGTSFEAYATL